MTDAHILPVAAEALLPPDGQAPRCAPFTRQLAVDPAGSAISAAVLVLVDTPLPWPKPVFAHELLDGTVGTLDTPIGPARVLASVADDEHHRVRIWWREGAATRAAVHAPTTRDELHELLAALAYVAPPELPYRTDELLADRTVLICTQGSHDVCCGTEGTKLAADSELDDLVVYRVSHTGGHRFSPTAMTLPDGRMWAYLDTDRLRQIIDRAGAPTEVASMCRGWWGAEPGAAQVAERSVFARSDWDWEDRHRTVEVVARIDGTTICDVHVDDATWQVEVLDGRPVPTIACRAPGGRPAKPALEYEVASIRIV